MPQMRERHGGRSTNHQHANNNNMIMVEEPILAASSSSPDRYHTTAGGIIRNNNNNNNSSNKAVVDDADIAAGLLQQHHLHLHSNPLMSVPPPKSDASSITFAAEPPSRTASMKSGGIMTAPSSLQSLARNERPATSIRSFI